MLRFFYTILFYLAIPFLLIKLTLRGIKLPAYYKRWFERFGFYKVKYKKSIWIHSVSVGETLAATPLIKKLLCEYPEDIIIVTTMTPTGAACVTQHFGDQVKHFYLPYDLPDAVHRFLRAVQPQIGIVIETELWPNLLAACKKKHIPVCLINARLSLRSAKLYSYIAKMTSPMLQTFTCIATQTEDDAKRFISLGAHQQNVLVTGNIKFDVELPANIEFKNHARPTWIAASTHEGEEEIVYAAHQLILNQFPQALLVLVPRHPDRFASIAKRATHLFTIKKRSQQENVTADTQLYFGDTMGELLQFYAMSDIAFVGGSLVEVGGHNFLEPAVLAKPILSGPHRFNFLEISKQFEMANALDIVIDAQSMAKKIIYYFSNREIAEAMGKRGQAIVYANRGTLQKQFECIQKVIKEAMNPTPLSQ